MATKNHTWVLNFTTNVSVDNVIVEEGTESSFVWVFSSFESAKETMKRIIKSYALTPNSIFDGKGLCTDYYEYIEERKCWPQHTEPEESEFDTDEFAAFSECWKRMHGGYDDDAKSFWKAAELPVILKSYLADMDNFSPDAIPTVTWTDYLMGCKSSPDKILIEGVDDGPCNGINPFFLINTFNMDDPEKDYNFCVRNGWNDNWEYMYLHLNYVEVDEEVTFPLQAGKVEK